VNSWATTEIEKAQPTTSSRNRIMGNGFIR